MASTRKLTKSLTRSLTRKLTGDELKQLFLEKFKLTLGSELIANGNFDDTSAWTVINDATINTSTNSATIDGTSQTSHIVQGILTEGKTYVLTFDVSSDNGTGNRWITNNLGGSGLYYSVTGNGSKSVTFTHTDSSSNLFFTARSGGSFVVSNISVKEAIKQAPVAAFSLRKLGDVSPYACRIRRSSDNTEAQVMFDASDRVSESSVVRNTSQNLLSFSEQLNNSAWSNNQGGTATLSTITDPFGGTNSYEVSGGSQTYGGIYDTITGLLTEGKSYTYSLYLKKGTSTKSRIVLYDSDNDPDPRMTVIWNSDGVPSLDSSDTHAIATKIEKIGDYGWYRIGFTGVALNTSGVQSVTIEPDRNGTGKTVYAFGAMLEETVTFESTGSTVTGYDSTFSGTGPKQWGSSNSSLASVSGGKGVFNTNSTQNLRIFTLLTIGKKYKVQFDVEDYVSGSVRAHAPFSFATYNAFTPASANGTFTFEGICTNDALYISTVGATELKIDNVVVTEFDPIPSEYISTPIVSNDGLTFTESTLDDFVGGENKLSYSEDFSYYSNDANYMTVENFTGTTPIGNTYARLTVNTNASAEKNLYLNQNFAITAGETYVASVYVRNNSIIDSSDGSNEARLFLQRNGLGTYEGTGVTIPVSSEWQRISVSHTFSHNQTGLRAKVLGLHPADQGSIEVIGFQVNSDSLKTYQKTTGTERDGNSSVVVLYNQTGGEDIIQDTQAKQPLLYSAGLLVKANASPSIKFDGTDDVMKFSPDEFGNGLNLNSLSSFLVFKADNISSFDYVFNLGTATNDKDWFLPFINSGNFVVRYGTNSNSGTTGNTNVNLFSGVAGLQSGKFKAFLNGTQHRRLS